MHYKQRGASFFYILFLFKLGTKMQNTKVLKAVGSKCYLSMQWNKLLTFKPNLILKIQT